MKIPQRTLEEKMVLILDYVCKAPRKWTRAKLRDALGYKSTKALHEPLRELVKEGLIHEDTEDRPQGVPRLVYWQTPKGCEFHQQLFEEEG